MRAVEKIKWRERMEIGWCGWASLWKWQGHQPHKDWEGKYGRSWGAGGPKSCRWKSQAGTAVREVGGRPTQGPWEQGRRLRFYFQPLEGCKQQNDIFWNSWNLKFRLFCNFPKLESSFVYWVENEWRRWDHLGDHRESKREMTVMNLQMVRPSLASLASLAYLWRSYGNRSASHKGFDN